VYRQIEGVGRQILQVFVRGDERVGSSLGRPIFGSFFVSNRADYDATTNDLHASRSGLDQAAASNVLECPQSNEGVSECAQ
jgi:hypothetical protein